MDKIVGHGIVDVVMKYRIRRYWYSSKEDTYEPESQIPEHFFKRYWKRLRQNNVRPGRYINYIDFSKKERGGIGSFFE